MQRLGTANFVKFSELIYKQFGIHYNDTKRDILQTKLNKLMSRYNMASYDECYDNLLSSGNKTLIGDFANEVTVNYTSFFREPAHFEFIRENAAALFENKLKNAADNEIRIWSAACSTGEEPYTLAMVLREALPAGSGIRILATDINKKVLAAALQGLYSFDVKKEVEGHYLNKYFCKTPDGYLLSESIKSLVSFRQFNLINGFPFKKTFDMVFCRNVMIYFDAAVRQELVNKFYRILGPEGLLFIGHSESLIGQNHSFRYVRPAIYARS